ncbi:MAG: FkbM family methyltransferase [Candidatus Hodarchaeota archaeon]
MSNFKGELFVDVGANVGFYSIMMSKNYKNVVAFEPEPSNMEELRKNIRICSVNNILCIQKAVSNNNGTIQLNLSDHMGGHSILGRSNNNITVNTCSLTSFFEKDINIDLIKVDVEGAEWMVLEGSEKIIDKIISWLIELHDIKRKKELEEWFISRGYSIYWLLLRKHEAFIYAWKNN